MHILFDNGACFCRQPKTLVLCWKQRPARTSNCSAEACVPRCPDTNPPNYSHKHLQCTAVESSWCEMGITFVRRAMVTPPLPVDTRKNLTQEHLRHRRSQLGETVLNTKPLARAETGTFWPWHIARAALRAGTSMKSKRVVAASYHQGLATSFTRHDRLRQAWTCNHNGACPGSAAIATRDIS